MPHWLKLGSAKWCKHCTSAVAPGIGHRQAHGQVHTHTHTYASNWYIATIADADCYTTPSTCRLRRSCSCNTSHARGPHTQLGSSEANFSKGHFWWSGTGLPGASRAQRELAIGKQ